MKRSFIRRTAGLLVILMVSGCLPAGCGKPSTFEGSRVSSETGFWLEYSILDRQETADLSLEEGEQIQVSITHTSGDVDVTVGCVGGEPIYKGSGQTNADFVLTIPETGTYRISITGHRAKGAVSFIRIPAKEE